MIQATGLTKKYGDKTVVDGLDFTPAGALLRKLDDLSHAGGNEDPFPHAVVTHAERPLYCGMHVGAGDVTLAQSCFDAGVMFFEEREKHVFRSHVVLIVVAALLLGGAKNSARRRAEL